MAILIAVYAAAHMVLLYYTALDPRFLVRSPHGLAALIDYELGRYASASRHWRLQYRLGYDPATAEHSEKVLVERIAREPAKLESYYLLGDSRFNRGDYTGAAAAYRAALAQRQDDYEANVGLATALAMLGEYKQSDAVFAALLRQGNQQKSISSFLHTLVSLDKLEHAKGAQDSDRYLTLALLNRYLRIIDTRRKKDVMLYADRALALNGKLYDAYTCKGMMYQKDNQYQEALEQFSKAAAVNPLSYDARNRMAYIYGVLGDVEQELACYKKAVELQPGDALSAYRLGELLHKKYGDDRQASVYFKRALEANPGDYENISEYGYILLLLKDYDGALDVCARMNERFPDRPYNYKLKADCFMGMKRYREAIQYYLKSHELAASTGEETMDFLAIRALGLAYSKLNQRQAAIAACRRALQIKPYDVDTLFELQYQYRMAGRFEEAYAAVKEILRLQPKHDGARRLLPYLQRNVGVGRML